MLITKFVLGGALSFVLHNYLKDKGYVSLSRIIMPIYFGIFLLIFFYSLQAMFL